MIAKPQPAVSFSMRHIARVVTVEILLPELVVHRLPGEAV